MPIFLPTATLLNHHWNSCRGVPDCSTKSNKLISFRVHQAFSPSPRSSPLWFRRASIQTSPKRCVLNSIQNAQMLGCFGCGASASPGSVLTRASLNLKRGQPPTQVFQPACRLRFSMLFRFFCHAVRPWVGPGSSWGTPRGWGGGQPATFSSQLIPWVGKSAHPGVTSESMVEMPNLWLRYHTAVRLAPVGVQTQGTPAQQVAESQRNIRPKMWVCRLCCLLCRPPATTLRSDTDDSPGSLASEAFHGQFLAELFGRVQGLALFLSFRAHCLDWGRRCGWFVLVLSSEWVLVGKLLGGNSFRP